MHIASFFKRQKLFLLTRAQFNSVSLCVALPTRSGGIYTIPGSGTLKYIGNNGSYWSSTTTLSPHNASYLVFHATSNYISFYDSRSLGFTIRCITN